MGPLKSPKCNGGNGHFREVPNTLAGPTLYTPNFRASGGHLLNFLCNVTVAWPKCRNQNFGRCVTRNRACWIDWNGTVTPTTQRPRCYLRPSSLPLIPHPIPAIWRLRGDPRLSPLPLSHHHRHLPTINHKLLWAQVETFFPSLCSHSLRRCTLMFRSSRWMEFWSSKCCSQQNGWSNTISNGM